MSRTKLVAGQIAALDLMNDETTTTATPATDTTTATKATTEAKECKTMKKATAKKATPATEEKNTTATPATDTTTATKATTPAPVDVIPETGDGVKPWTFAADRVTVSGREFKAGYSIGKTGDIWAFVDFDGMPIRIHITAAMPIYPDALQAAKAAKLNPAAEPMKAAAEPAKKAEPTKAAAEPAKKAEPMKTATEPAKKAEPMKATTGDALQGKNWRILFDAEAQRTRVIIDAPTDAQAAAITEAGFYWSGAMQSYNKKLTMKARRAAEALAATLTAAAEPAKAAEPMKAAAEPAKKAEPMKATTGDALQGKNWRILFDAETQRTRVIIDAPTDAQAAAITEAGFYWSGAMQSYNKKLTMKARRAAEALAATLAGIAC